MFDPYRNDETPRSYRLHDSDGSHRGFLAIVLVGAALIVAGLVWANLPTSETASAPPAPTTGTAPK